MNNENVPLNENGGPAQRQVQSVAELRDLIAQTQQGRPQEAPRTYIWIPFTQEQCAVVKNDRPRATLNENAIFQAEATGVRQIAMDLRRQAGEDLTKPYTEAELCAAFNASANQAQLLEHAAQKSPTVIQMGVDNPRPPQQGDTVYILAHGSNKHDKLFANAGEAKLTPDEVVVRMQQSGIADDIAKLKLLSCGSSEKIHQSLALACQEKGAYLETKLSGYGFSLPGVPSSADLPPSELKAQNFSYIRSAQPDVAKLTSNMNLGHVVTAIREDFEDVASFTPNTIELQANVSQLQATHDDLANRLNAYDDEHETDVLNQLQEEMNTCQEELLDLYDEENSPEVDVKIERKEAELLRHRQQVDRQNDFIEDGQAMKEGLPPPNDMLLNASILLLLAKDELDVQLKNEARIQQKMGLQPGGQPQDASVRKSTEAKVVAKVRDVIRGAAEVVQNGPGQEVPGQNGPEDLQAGEGYYAGPAAPRAAVPAPPPPPPPPLPKAGTPSTRDQFKRAGGNSGGSALKMG